MASKKYNFLKKTFIGITLVIILGTVPKQLFVQPINAHSISEQENIKNSLIYSQVKPDKLIQQGKEYYQAQNYTEAIKIWQKTQDIYQSQQDKLNQATVLNYLGLAYIKSGKLPEAEKSDRV